MSSLKDEVEDEPEPEDEPEDETPEDEPEDEENEDEDPEEDDELEDEDEEDDEPKVQSKEDNAKFAAKRRQQELESRVQAELDKLKQESPEFKLAQQLSKQFGKSPEEIMVEMEEEDLKREAEATKIPIERLRQERETADRVNLLETQLNDLRYQAWQTQINSDKQALQTKYPMLTGEDMDNAVDYILTTLQNVEVPLEQAVYSLHGQKIIEALADQKVQENLAKESGRKRKTPLAPNTTKKPQKITKLSADEKEAAKIFGMSEEEYEKYKS
jgi:phage I-like protein